MFRLKSLELRNFMSIGEAKIDFVNSGLVFISGYNEKGGDSNGAGKSAIINGLVWTLFGRTPVGLRTSDIIRWGCKSVFGALTLEKNGQLYRIVRTDDNLYFTINDERVKGLRKDVQDIINSTFQTSYDLFMTFNVFTRNWNRFITEIGDADRKKLFKSVLNLQILDKALEKCKVILNTLKTTASVLESKINDKQREIGDAERRLKLYWEEARFYNEKKERDIAKLLADKEARKPILDSDLERSLEQLVNEINTIDKDSIEQELSVKGMMLRGLTETISQHKYNISDIKSRIQGFSSLSSECPTCGQSVTMKAKAIRLKQLNSLLKQYESSLEELEKEYAQMTGDIHLLSERLENYKSLLSKKQNLEVKVSYQKEAIKQYESFCKDIDKAIEHIRSSTENYVKLIEQQEKAIKDMKEELKLLEDSYKSALNEIDIYSYISNLYSRHGVISVIIKQCFSRLKYLANSYVMPLCSEGFQIEISPVKALKSGDIQEDVDIYIIDANGRKVSYNNLSAGQQQRINTALLIALFIWGREIQANPFDFILLDEVLDLSLGSKGQEDTINLVSNLKKLINHIIIISHRDIPSEYIDVHIKAIRSLNGITTINVS